MTEIILPRCSIHLSYAPAGTEAILLHRLMVPEGEGVSVHDPGGGTQNATMPVAV